jgi:DNA-binding NtrC family response regulator
MKQNSQKIVLIVDDDDSIRRLLARIFLERGHKVILAENSQQALESCKSTQFDIAFVDTDLGMEDGIVLARQLLKTIQGIRIVVMSGNPENAPRVQQTGLGRMLDKPFKISTISKLIDSD